ncbi:PASTA domain-containing protein [Erysipelotrichaceae bacterium OttesenSCG-928-M19]|nr:PASTA domain-containing protein [Erysipelotrichaceae bacterium OttesenSCG-928-M19]
MSDFLNKFTEDNYDGEKITATDLANEKKMPNPLKTAVNSHSYHNNDNDDEIIIKDKNYTLNKRRQRLSYLIGALVSLIIVISLVVWLNIVKVPNLVDKDLNQVKSWAQKSNINLIISESYSNKKDENIVVEQEKKQGSRIFKRSDFEITVSIGADPDEKIEVPNLVYMNLESINNWIADNKLDNVELKGVHSSKHDKDSVISVSYEGDLVSENNYYRKDKMIIKISKGKASLAKNIIVPDFKTTDKYEVQDWANENGVSVYYSYSTHAKKAKDSIISQSIKKDTKISSAQTINVVVSLGKSVKVPDFSKMTKSAASQYSSLKVSVSSQYSSSKKYGSLVSQSVKAGSYVTSSKKIKVVYSEGKPFIGDLSGYTKKEVEQYFYNLNLKGAKLKYKIVKQSSSNTQISKGLVIKTSVQNDYAKFNQTINVYIKSN